MRLRLPADRRPRAYKEASSDSLRERWQYLPRLVQLLWELGPRHLTLLALFSLAGGVLPVLLLILLQRLVDSAVGVIQGRVTLGTAMLWLGALLLAHFFHAVTDFWEEAWAGLLADVRERVKARAQERVFTKASRLSLATFEGPEFYDQLHRAERGIDTRLFITVEYLMPIPSDLLAAAGLLLYIGSAHWLFPLILLAGLLPTAMVNQRNFRRSYSLQRRQTAPERMLQYLSDLMVERKAAAEIRLFGLGEHLLERRRQLFHQLRDERLKLAREHVRRTTLSMGAEQLTYGLVLAGVVALIARGELSVGFFAAYWAAADRFRSTLSFLLRSTAVLDTDLRYIRDLFDYLDLAEEEETEAFRRPGVQGFGNPGDPALPLSARHPPPSPRAHTSSPIVRFEGVTFAYPGSDEPVLKEVNLTLSPGERIALVGENGTGKTTLARLLLGLYRPTAGRITVDGRDLGEIEPGKWRARTAAVFQDYVRYELTARENIGFGDLDRLEDEGALLAAAARSGADTVVAGLSRGLDTVLGKAYDEQGCDLSIGQWQKLAIARAYLREACVLVLDEPTAALDAKAEVEVYRQFRDMARGKSVLLISHRLGSARLADRILVLQGGRLVEEGSHGELIARGGIYARMLAVQAQWYL